MCLYAILLVYFIQMLIYLFHDAFKNVFHYICLVTYNSEIKYQWLSDGDRSQD